MVSLVGLEGRASCTAAFEAGIELEISCALDRCPIFEEFRTALGHFEAYRSFRGIRFDIIEGSALMAEVSSGYIRILIIFIKLFQIIF